MNRAYLLIGGNTQDPLQQLYRAERLIAERCGDLLLMSRIYRTAAWGPIPQANFFNRALLVATSLLPTQLLHTLLQIETEMGRIRTEKMGPRLIDIDILLLDDLQVANQELIIPHPLLAARRFALQPLTEIAPQLLHPVLGKTIETLLNECTDTGDVQKK
jgi:2-amino-4-hydroxy-6-hydroxymethyldihydropteridine diphosphokinase